MKEKQVMATILFAAMDDEDVASFKAEYGKLYKIHKAKTAKSISSAIKKYEIEIFIADEESLEILDKNSLNMIRIVATKEVDNPISAKQIYLLKPWDNAHLKVAVDNAIAMRLMDSGNREPDDEVLSLEEPCSCLKNMKILVAEDSETNQKIVEASLKRVGVHSEYASDGKSALALIHKNYYDAVLMDIEMPKLNGMEVAQILRTKEEYKTLPIIALTAHEDEESIREFLASGMNDYLQKPLEEQVLYRKLLKWGASIEYSDSELIQDSSELKDEEHFVSMDNTELANVDIEIMKSFNTQFGQFNQELELMLHNVNHDEVLRMIHTLKGVSGNIKANRLYQLTSEFEKLIKDDNWAQAVGEIDNLKAAVDEVLVFIAGKMAEQSEVTFESVEGMDMYEGLEDVTLAQKLVFALRENDLSALDIIKVIGIRCRDTDLKDLIEEAYEKISMLDFAGGLALSEQLLACLNEM